LILAFVGEKDVTVFSSEEKPLQVRFFLSTFHPLFPVMAASKAFGARKCQQFSDFPLPFPNFWAIWKCPFRAAFSCQVCNTLEIITLWKSNKDTYQDKP